MHSKIPKVPSPMDLYNFPPKCDPLCKKKPPQIIDMSTSGHLKFQGTNRATFVGTTSNIMFDTTSTSLGIGVTGTDHPSSNLYITGNAYVSSNIAVGGVLTMGTVNVVARHDLESVTATGNITPLTVEFTNPTTSLVASGNVEVGTANLFVDTVNNRVGIGTTSPQEKLDVAGTAPYLSITDTRTSSGGTTGRDLGGVVFRTKDITDPSPETGDFLAKIQVTAQNAGSFPDGSLNFFVSDDGDLLSSPSMVIEGVTGNVGVGTVNPGAQLEVVKGTTAAPLTTETTVMQLNSTISGSTGTAASYFKFQHVPESSPVDWTDWSGRLQFVTDTTNQGYMEFNPPGSGYGIAFGNTGGGSAAGEIMRLLGTGQVGIGYNNPSEKLEVNGNIRANHLNLDGTQLVNNLQIASTAGTWHELADTSALTSGLYIFQVTWGSAADNTTRIWSGGTSFDLYVRAGISGIYNSSALETISHNPVYHYRTVSGYLFGHDSNSVNGNYGQQTIYIQSPQSSVTINGLSVVAYKIG